MTDTNTTQQPEKPKMSLTKKAIYALIAIVGLLLADHWSTNFVSGGADVTVTDSTIVVTPMVDAGEVAQAVTPAVTVDTTSHKDTAK